jgi:hypothetical protein
MTTSRTPSSGRQFEHGVEQDLFHDRAQATGAGLALDAALLGDLLQRFLVEGQLDLFHLEQTLILLDQGVLRLGQDLDQGRLVEILERREHRQTADEFRNQAELHQIFRLDIAQDSRRHGVRPGREHWRRNRSRSSRRVPR